MTDERIDWHRVGADLDADGSAAIGSLLSQSECELLASLYPLDERDGRPLFRSRIDMRRHGFGSGEYKYFAYPLPEPVATLRAGLYARLAPLANRWQRLLGSEVRYPTRLDRFLSACHAAGQARPTPLLLHYREGDFNCLHQDLYGEWRFPLQVVILLSEPGRDFDGGELVMTEQRPRMQSRPIVVPLRQGDAAVIAVDERPVRGTRGVYRVRLRHGVSRVRAGRRLTCGIIFHDAA